MICPRTEPPTSHECQSPVCARISSLRPSSRYLLNIQMYFLQPISDGVRYISSQIPSLDHIQLRPKRLYKNPSFYWRIFWVNCALRFTWMLCFIPAYRLSTSEEKDATFSSDVNSYVGVLLPMAEIIRRCYWGFLKMEMETIRMMDSNTLYSRIGEGDNVEEEDDDNSDKARSSFRIPTWLDTQQKQQHDAATSSFSRSTYSRLGRVLHCSDAFRHQLFIAELTLWAGAFVGLGYWAAC